MSISLLDLTAFLICVEEISILGIEIILSNNLIFSWVVKFVFLLIGAISSYPNLLYITTLHFLNKSFYSIP